MTEIFGVPVQALFGQLMLGLVNGSFYAMLSLGLAVIFGLLGVVNFAHGAMYMLGAYVAWLGYDGIDLTHVQVGSSVLNLGIKFQFNFWVALLVGPLVVGMVGVVVEKSMLKRLYKLDPLYGLLLTFGLALIMQGVFLQYYGSSGQSYDTPEALTGATNLGFMILPNYRGFVVAASLVGSNLIIVVFAVVVIGGMGSIIGSILTGLVLGLVEGLTRVFYPEASNVVVFFIMAIVLMIRPAGLFGKEK